MELNYKRWAAYIDDLIKKYNTKTSRDETKSCEPLEKSIDYSKINLSECKIPENFKPMTLNEVAAALLPEKEPLDEETNDEEIKDEDRDVNEWYYMDNDTKRYKGEWKNGKPNGKGAMEFIKNKATDFEGKLLKETNVIECTFIEGAANGYGRQILERTYEQMGPY